MRFERHSAHQAGQSLWAALNTLFDKTPGIADPMLHPDFARLAAETRSDTEILLALDGDEPVAAWPLHCRRGGWARPVGGPFSDWHGMLGDPSETPTVTELMAGCGIAGATVFGYRPRPGEPCLTGERVGGHVTLVPDSYAAWQAEQKTYFAKHFKNLRRVKRNLERDFSEIELQIDDPSDAAFDTIIALKREQFARTNRHDVLAPGWAQSFVAALRGHQMPHLRIQTSTLYVDGRFAAGEINLCSETVVHGWLTAFAPEFATYSPGYQLTDAIIAAMPNQGRRLYDAGCDMDHYKKYFSNAMLPMDRGVIRAEQSLMAPSRLLGAGWKSLEHALPDKASALMGKIRRRSDQILTSETDALSRAKGFAGALTS